MALKVLKNSNNEIIESNNSDKINKIVKYLSSLKSQIILQNCLSLVSVLSKLWSNN